MSKATQTNEISTEESTDTLIPELLDPPSKESTSRQSPKREILVERISDYAETFLEAVAKEADPDAEIKEYRYIDVVECNHGLQFLAGYPDGTQILVARDETSKNSGFFSIVLEENSGVKTVADALETLKPDSVKVAERTEDIQVRRQGEWWFVEANEEPAFSVSGELGVKPFGYSPMDTHVAKEYGFGLKRDELLRELSLYISDGECKQVFDNVPRCFDSIRNRDILWEGNWSGRFPEFDWDRIESICEGIYVRGTVRHRNREHYMLDLEDNWYQAFTHDATVYQPLPSTYRNSILISQGSYVD